MTVSKRKAIRITLSRLGLHASSARVVDVLESQGVEVGTDLVARVKAQMFRHDAKAERERLKRPPATRRRNRPQQRKIPPRRG